MPDYPVSRKPCFIGRSTAIHKIELDTDTRDEIESLFDFLEKATQKSVKSRENRKNSKCDIRGQIHFAIADAESSGNDIIDSHYCMIRKTDRFDEHYFKNRDYRGIPFYFPIAKTKSLVEVRTIFILCDNKELVLDSKSLGYDVLAQIIKRVVQRLEDYAFYGGASYCEPDGYSVDSDNVSEEDNGEDEFDALKKTAESIILAHKGIKPKGDALRKLGSKFGYTGVLSDSIFEAAYYDLAASGALK